MQTAVAIAYKIYILEGMRMKTRVLYLLLVLTIILSLIPMAVSATEHNTGDLSVQITHISLDPTKDALGL